VGGLLLGTPEWVSGVRSHMLVLAAGLPEDPDPWIWPHLGANLPYACGRVCIR